MRLCALDLPVPDYTHMSRRAATLEVKIPRRPRKGGTHVVVDATGLNIFGEGEWTVRQHGVGKPRTWRKIHLAVDETEKDMNLETAVDRLSCLGQPPEYRPLRFRGDSPVG